MNIRHYLELDAEGTEVICEDVGVDDAYRARRRMGVFTAEHHLRYFSELQEGETVSVHARVLERSDKAAHLMAFLLDRTHGRLANTLELVLVLGIEGCVLRGGHDCADERGAVLGGGLAGCPESGCRVGVGRLGDQLDLVAVHTARRVDLVHSDLPAVNGIGAELGQGTTCGWDERDLDGRVGAVSCAPVARAGRSAGRKRRPRSKRDQHRGDFLFMRTPTRGGVPGDPGVSCTTASWSDNWIKTTPGRGIRAPLWSDDRSSEGSEGTRVADGAHATHPATGSGTGRTGRSELTISATAATTMPPPRTTGSPIGSDSTSHPRSTATTGLT